MLAATSPTSCLSMPWTPSLVGPSTVKVMPSGASNVTGWRVAERELQLGRALGQDAVADADDLELLLVALGHADDHVVDQGAGQAVQRRGSRARRSGA